MSRLVVAPIVEGHGEVEAVRELLVRIWNEMIGGDYLEVLRPIREKRSRLATDKDRRLSKAVELAANKLAAHVAETQDPTLIFVLLDADNDLPCILGPRLWRYAKAARSDFDITCVVAKSNMKLGSLPRRSHCRSSFNSVPASNRPSTLNRPAAGRVGSKSDL